jgi:predicted nucleic-acid-binding protein
MIGLDTNILIRYLAQDDPVQSPKAREILERRLTEKDPGFVSVVAMVETVWVLDRAYGLSSRKIAAAVERMLQADVLVVENEQEVFTAMVALKRGETSFAGALIGAMRPSRLCSYPNIRPQGATPPGLRGSVSGPWATGRLDCRSIVYGCDAGVRKTCHH